MRKRNKVKIVKTLQVWIKTWIYGSNEFTMVQVVYQEICIIRGLGAMDKCTLFEAEKWLDVHEAISKFIISQFLIRNQKDNIFKGQKEKKKKTLSVCKYTFVKIVFNMGKINLS